MTQNPLLSPWRTPFAAPPFAEIAPHHFREAFDHAFDAHNDEIAAIVDDAEPPNFANTAEAFERAGALLARVSGVFWNLVGADANPELQAIEREIAPRAAAHRSAIYMNARLHARFEALWRGRAEAGYTEEQLRLLDRVMTAFRRSGVALLSEEKARLAAIVERLSQLSTRFSQNLLADEGRIALLLEAGDDLAGLPDWLTAAMARAAQDRGEKGKYAVTLARSIVEPFLVFSTRRDLRERAHRAWTMRGESGGETDNGAIVAETLRLRAEFAALLGYPTFAHYTLEDRMAGTPDRARELLETVWGPAREKVAAERADLARIAEEEGLNAPIEAWDWRHYAEKARKRHLDFDEAELKPYLTLDAVREAAFHVAGRLFGLSFRPRPDVPVYHPDVKVWEAVDEAGTHVGLFMADDFARASKRSGAWMSSFRVQDGLARERPVIVNVMNFAKPPEGKAALLSLDDARTLFHEFGHALHGLLSNVTYPRLAGTAVPTDFVELPSQLYEHWLELPEVLGRFARHVETDTAIPRALLDKIKAARTFGQGFATVEFTAAALVDLDFHSGPPPADPLAAEAETLARIGMPREIGMRHRTPHFSHIFGGGYAAGYYSYLWSEVLDADAFRAFLEAGDPFDAATARRLREAIYAAGNSARPEEAYHRFRGRLPTIDALLEKRGLSAGNARAA